MPGVGSPPTQKKPSISPRSIAAIDPPRSSCGSSIVSAATPAACSTRVAITFTPSSRPRGISSPGEVREVVEGRVVPHDDLQVLVVEAGDRLHIQRLGEGARPRHGIGGRIALREAEEGLPALTRNRLSTDPAVTSAVRSTSRSRDSSVARWLP